MLQPPPTPVRFFSLFNDPPPSFLPSSTNVRLKWPLSLGTRIQLKLTIFIFWTKFTQKGYFRSKKEKTNITIQISFFTKFQLKLVILFFGADLPKEGIFRWKQIKMNITN